MRYHIEIYCPITSMVLDKTGKYKRKLYLINVDRICPFEYITFLTTTMKAMINNINNSNKQQQDIETNFSSSFIDETIRDRAIMSKQATINIGIVGHVSHGKSKLVEAISGIKTAKHADQAKENRTKRLGYANAKIYKCPRCQAPSCYQSYPSYQQDSLLCVNPGCSSQLELIRHVSFCDCPGHDEFMSTMLTGAAIMDMALLIVAANVDCPQPQTAEHVSALEIMHLKNIIIVQNKIDLIFGDKDKLKQSYKQIKQFMKDTICKNAPIIPVCAQMEYNIDAILEAICQVPIPPPKLNVPPLMTIIRSFDINKPGESFENIKGGVVGGTIQQGVLEVGMEIEIRPGLLCKDERGHVKCTPIKSKIISLGAQTNTLEFAYPGGLIGVGLLIDPSLTRNDKMIGNVLGKSGTLPEVWTSISVKFYLMKHLLGSMDEGTEVTKIKKIVEGEVLKINVKSTVCSGKITKLADDIATLKLSQPVCTSLREKIALSRRFNKKFRLIGYGQIVSGINYEQ